MTGGCGAPEQDGPAANPGAGEALIQGVVRRDGAAVPFAYVRLLDEDGEFTAEVVSSQEGAFRFFARPGRWRVRVLAATGSGEASVVDAPAGQSVHVVVDL